MTTSFVRAARRACALLCVLIAAGPAAAPAQVSSFLRERPFLSGARALGFADAYVADIHDVNSMYWNPAALVYLENSSIVLNHTLDRVSNIMNENAAAPVWMRRGEVVAAGFSVNHVGMLGKSATGDFKATQYSFDVAYAREILPTFSAGASAYLRTASGTNTAAIRHVGQCQLCLATITASDWRISGSASIASRASV